MLLILASCTSIGNTTAILDAKASTETAVVGSEASPTGQAEENNEADNWYHYGPGATLEGMLEIEEFPKYDGSQEKARPYILVLDAPINVKGEKAAELNTGTYTQVKKVQVAFVPDQIKNIDELADKKVVVTGELYEAHTAHHYTDVLIFAKTIKGK